MTLSLAYSCRRNVRETINKQEVRLLVAHLEYDPVCQRHASRARQSATCRPLPVQRQSRVSGPCLLQAQRPVTRANVSRVRLKPALSYSKPRLGQPSSKMTPSPNFPKNKRALIRKPTDGCTIGMLTKAEKYAGEFSFDEGWKRGEEFDTETPTDSLLRLGIGW
jgi:hypothetical protein